MSRQDQQSEQSIEVRPSVLKNLVVDVESGRYRIPQFQREYVWKKRKVIELLDSIYQEFPIGSFFIWRAGRGHNDLFRHSVELGLPAVRADDDVCFILDGQQRITSLYVTLKGMEIRGTDYSRICFDLKDEKFIYLRRGSDNKRYISVCDIWGSKAVGLMRKVDEDHVGAFERIYETLRTYPISIVEVRDKDLSAVCKIFQRINQSGKRLDRFDLISAMTFTKDFDLRERLTKDIQRPLKEKGFGKISPIIVTQLMALLKFGACTERNEFALDSASITAMWDGVVDAVLLAADALRKSMGVVNADYLPYDALLTLLSYVYAKSGKRSLSAEQMAWVEQWFWRASFGEYFASGGPTKMGRDREQLDELIGGSRPTFEHPVNLTVERLVGTRMTRSMSAVRNAFLCLLATRKPVHLANNSPLDLVNGGISGFTNREKHHIFPQAFLRNSGHNGALVHSLPNFCFLPSELNKEISGSRPSEYIPRLRAKNPEFDKARKTHFIPPSSDAGLETDDYLKFLQARGELVHGEICRLCGTVTTPREDERHQTIEVLEGRLRDCIHTILFEAFGEQYWKTAIPNALREEAETRIAADLKTPDRKKEDVASPRAKLDYCNVMDYVTIIENKANWPYFTETFRRREDLQQHVKAFSDYRNAIMHVRDMTEFVQLGGERAMIWLESVLADEDIEGEDGTEDAED